MRPIIKSPEPATLSAYRQTRGASFDGLPSPAKQDLKEQLLLEQGHLCAYCMSRIKPENMKVEHWHCQKKHPGDQLSYSNLLACCAGGEGGPPRTQHCDTLKGDADLTFNPADPSHHGRLKMRFPGDGLVRSDDPVFDQQLNQVLNLNLPELVNNRRAVADAVREVLRDRPGSRTKAELDRLVRRWEQRDSQGKLPAYCEVALYHLRKHANY